MKKLLATTAMCLVMTTGLNNIAAAHEVTATVAYNAADFTETTVNQSVLMIEKSLYRGDFQQIARTSVADKQMYAGIGSRLMVSIQSIRE